MSVKDLIKGYFLSAVTWKDTTIILGKSSEIYLHEAGRWCQKTASGDAPYIVNEIATTVLGDAMYILGAGNSRAARRHSKTRAKSLTMIAKAQK